MFFPSKWPRSCNACLNTVMLGLLGSAMPTTIPIRGTFGVCCVSAEPQSSKKTVQKTKPKMFLNRLWVTVFRFKPLLSDHPIRSRQHVGRNRQADLFCCLEIDDQVELCWLFDGQIGGLCALENLVHVSGGAAGQVT